jgi:serine/threonine protein kinase
MVRTPIPGPTGASSPASPAPLDGLDPLAGSGYETLGRLGAGGSAEILLARHVALGRRVAVKLLKQELCELELYIERMRLEARALGHLEHPNIAKVTDFGQTADGRPFVVLEYLQGRTLLDELRQRGYLPVDEAVALMLQLLSGLAAAHALGIVHRDLKPENLFLCTPENGPYTLKILDFGVAKIRPGPGTPSTLDPLRVRSYDGVPVGTLPFLSPEQVMGRDVDARTDVYGAGLVFYELLTGRLPFGEIADPDELLKAQVARTPPAPSIVAPQPIEPAIDDVVMCMLAKRPEDRYAGAAELADALRRASAMTPAARVAPEEGTTRVRRGPASLRGLALVGLGIAVGALLAAACLEVVR